MVPPTRAPAPCIPHRALSLDPACLGLTQQSAPECHPHASHPLCAPIILHPLTPPHQALSSVESQSLVEPSRVQRLKQDLSSLGSLACLLAWRAVARERRRQAAAAAAAAAAALQPAWLPAAASAASGTAAAATTAAGDGAASAAAAGGAAAAAMAAGAAAVGAAVVGGAAAGAALGGAVAGRQDADGLRGTGPTALVSTAVQTEHSLSLEGVRELVTSFRALADSSNPSTRLCLDTLNLVDFYLSREAWNYQEDGGQGDHDDDADQAFVGGQQQGAGGDVGHGEVAGVEGEAGVEEEGVEEEEV